MDLWKDYICEQLKLGPDDYEFVLTPDKKHGDIDANGSWNGEREIVKESHFLHRACFTLFSRHEATR